MALPWFRLYTEFASDPKIQILSFDDQRHFVMILCLKGNGMLDSVAPNDAYRERLIARALGLDAIFASEVKRRLTEGGLIDSEWQPLNWDKRQFDSDSAASRMRKYRDKLKGNAPVTAPLRNGYGLDTDTDTDREKKEESPRSKAARAARLPNDFELTPERRKVCEKEGIANPVREFQKFCDYWAAASGANARKHDWDATWRNWCRRAGEMSKPPVRGSPEAIAAWDRLIITDGAERTPKVQKALEAIGGWSAIRMRDNYSEPKLKQQFRDAYERA